MILNTTIILEQVCTKDPNKPNTNPLKIKQEKQAKYALEKEKKLQEQVAVIFKDTKYYKNFQESALPEQKTPEQIAKEEEDKKRESEAEKLRMHQIKKTFSSALGGSIGYAAGKTGIETGMNLIGKGAVTAADLVGRGIKHLIT